MLHYAMLDQFCLRLYVHFGQRRCNSTYYNVLVTYSQCKQSLTYKFLLPCISVSLQLIFAVLSIPAFELWNSLELSWFVGLEDDVADATTGLFTSIFFGPDIISLSTDGTKSLLERAL